MVSDDAHLGSRSFRNDLGKHQADVATFWVDVRRSCGGANGCRQEVFPCAIVPVGRSGASNPHPGALKNDARVACEAAKGRAGKTADLGASMSSVPSSPSSPELG